MSKKIGLYEDAKARLKHQTLMQDYEELQKEADGMRSRFETAKQRKLMLAAEVRFLRRRHKYLLKTKNTSSSQEQNTIQRPNKSLKQTKIKKVTNQARKKGLLHNLAPISTPFISDLYHKGRIHISKEALNTTRNAVDVDQNERICGSNDAVVRNSVAAFDLNQDSNSVGGKEASLPSRAPIFDLNEISTGEEEDFQSNVEAMELDDTKKSLIFRGINDDQQNDLRLAMCRNAGEGSSRVGKRKISWQDPVALRV